MPAEPLIVSFGRQFLDDYAPTEFRDALKRAFTSWPRADFIVLDNNMRGQRFLAACAAWAIDRGLLFWAETAEDDQCAVSTFRLTVDGKLAFGLPLTAAETARATTAQRARSENWETLDRIDGQQWRLLAAPKT